VLRDAERRPFRSTAAVRDITRERETEQALRESEERTRLAMQAGRMFAFEWNPRTDEVQRSHSCDDITGALADTTREMGTESFRRVHPDDQERLSQTIRSLTPLNSRYEIQYRVIPPDGEVATLQQSGRAFFNDDGVMIRLIGMTADITERKRAETALRQSEERFRAIFSQAAVGIAQTGPDRKWLLLNDRFCEILGYTQAELCGKAFLNLTHADDRDASGNAFRRLLAGEISSWSTEKRYVRKDGNIVWVRLWVSLVRDHDNQPQYFISVVEDITERIRAEHALRDSERRFALAQSAAHLGTWERNLRTDVKTISGEYAKLYGLVPDHAALTYGEWLNMIHPDDRDRLQTQIQESIERTGSWDTEFRVIWPDGSIHWILTKGTVFLDESGQPVRRAGVNLDITERRQAEQALRESEERFRNMADTAPVMIWLLGPDKCVTFVNKAWLDFTGRTWEQELGKGWMEGLHPDDRDRGAASIVSSFKARQPFHSEGRLKRADGEYRWVLCSGVPRFERDGAFAGYIGSTIDITDQKYAEAERRRSLDELAHLNRVAAMSELTASMAHELNQPLAAILSNAQAASRLLSSETPDLAELRECLTDIVADDKRASEVIRGLRGLLKKGKSQASAVDLNEVVADVIRMVRNDALLRQAALTFEPSPGLPRLVGDRIQLYQVALNLIVNGLDAATERPQCNRSVVVRTAEWDGGGVQLTVEDSGSGIAERDLAKVFEPFFTTKPEGLGMGLSISRSIVRAYGGRIWAENSASGGAIFRCVLPAAQGTAAAAGS
jgi:PAS domain S-box-containing protein